MEVTAKGCARLVLVEGLPGSGKSTTSHLLCLHMERLGHAARWYWEHETPHPVFESSEVAEILDHGGPGEALFEAAVENWRRLAADLAGSGRSLIIESSFFQTPIHPMLLMDWEEERIAAYVLAVERAIAAASPMLVVLRQDDIAAGVREITARRGDWFQELIEGRLRRSLYGRRRGLQGVEGVVRYLAAYRTLTDRLLERLGTPRLVVDEGTVPKHAFGDRIAAALGLPPLAAFETRVPDAVAFAGRYKDTGSDEVYDVVTDGEHLYVDARTEKTRLIHRGGGAFDLAGTCVRLDFCANGDGRIQALECRGNLPNLARDWVRAA